MEAVWRDGELRVRDVHERFQARLAYTTVMTTMDRLYKKGLLERRKEGRAFVYSARVTRRQLAFDAGAGAHPRPARERGRAGAVVPGGRGHGPRPRAAGPAGAPGPREEAAGEGTADVRGPRARGRPGRLRGGHRAGLGGPRRGLARGRCRRRAARRRRRGPGCSTRCALLPAALGAIVAGALASAAWLRLRAAAAAEPLGVAARGAPAGLVLRSCPRGQARPARVARRPRPGARVDRGGDARPPSRDRASDVPHRPSAGRWCAWWATLRPRLFVAEKRARRLHAGGAGFGRWPTRRATSPPTTTSSGWSRSFLPDVLPWLPAGRALDKAWESASEAAADARAAAARPGAVPRPRRRAAARGAPGRGAAPGSPLPARALLDGGERGAARGAAAERRGRRPRRAPASLAAWALRAGRCPRPCSPPRCDPSVLRRPAGRRGPRPGALIY